MHILIVDDFQGMRSLLRDILREKGARHIDLATNGNEAITRLSAQAYDVVFCDFNLGAGKNGQQVLEEAKYRNMIGPACVWIMISGEKTADAVFGAAEFQPDAYLVKPLTAALIFTRLEKTWSKKASLLEIDQAMRNKDLPKALRACDDRIQTDKANVIDLMKLKGGILVSMGELGKAADLYDSILARRDFPWAKTGLAKIRLQQGKLDDAKALFESVINENPAYIEAYDGLAKTLQQQGLRQETKGILERAVKLSPNSTGRQKLLGDVALETGDLVVAEKAYAKSVASGANSIFKSPDSYFCLAKVKSAAGKPEEALRAINDLKKQFTGDNIAIQATIAEGVVYQENGPQAKAKEIAGKLRNVADEAAIQMSPTVTMEMAKLMLLSGGMYEKDKGLSLLQSVIRNNHYNPYICEQVQSVFDKADMSEAGKKLVESASREATELMDKGVLLTREGKLLEAINLMRDARKMMPTNVRLLLNTIYVMLLMLEKSDEELSLVEEVETLLAEVNRLQPDEPRGMDLARRFDKFKARVSA
ncbi:response regulator [Burkholderiaceae bacterium DAT-1]|nr:response regulator [Burkholderiaceae bacterium DAT-1]